MELSELLDVQQFQKKTRHLTVLSDTCGTAPPGTSCSPALEMPIRTDPFLLQPPSCPFQKIGKEHSILSEDYLST